MILKKNKREILMINQIIKKKLKKKIRKQNKIYFRNCIKIKSYLQIDLYLSLSNQKYQIQKNKDLRIKNLNKIRVCLFYKYFKLIIGLQDSLELDV